MCNKDKSARTPHFKGNIKCRPSAIHRGDEDAVNFHAEHDDRHGTTERSALSDDGKSGLLHRVNGQQPISNAADDVQREQHGGRQCAHLGATAAASPTDRGSDGRRRGLSLEHDGKPERVEPSRPLRWPAKLVTAAAVWNAVIPLSQTAAPVQAFLTTRGLGTDVWLIQDGHIPSRGTPDLPHQARVSGNPELSDGARASSFLDVCHQDRASGNPGLCEQGRAASTSGVCQQVRACNYGDDSPEGLPRPWCSEMKEIDRTRLGEIWVPSGTIRTSAAFTCKTELQDALKALPQAAVVWIRLESSTSGQKLEDRPYQASVPEWDDSDGPVKCTLWLLSSKLHWLATWADNLSSILRVDEELEVDQKCWAIQSTALTELLQEEEGREIPVKGHLSDLKRCGNSLTALALREKRASSQIDFAELFSPPRVSPKAKALGLRVPDQVFDLEAGWDVRKVDHRRDFRKFQKECRPRFLTLSPECKAYSQLMNINWERMDPQRRAEIEREGSLMWNFSLESAENQVDMGDYFALEHPAGAKSWKLERTQALLRRPEVAVIEFDQCALGQTVVPSGELSRKRTRIATNHAGLALQLAGFQCTGDHVHIPLENNLAGKARVYPPALCHLLAQSAKEAVLGLPVSSFPAFSLATDWPEDEEEETTGQPASSISETADADILEKDETQPKVTESQKRMVLKVHVNTGHPPQEQFLRMMRAGGAHSHVLKYIKEDFQCEQCALKTRPDNRRRAHCPRSFAFNRVVSTDVLYVKFQQKSIPILNMVCTGSNYQVAQRLPVPEGNTGAAPTSETTWRHFLQTWIRFFGPPSMLICDSGNEFKSRFERGCESQGILQHVILPECPWQNSKAERHGGWLKEKLDKEANSGSCTFTSLLELDEFLTYLTAAKNRWFSRSGYTPAALVFGETPRISGELLSDDFPGLCGHEDAHSDPYGVDDASAEFKRRHEIRERARQAAMEQTSKEAISRAVKSATHQSRNWAPGQWVYVFRRGRPSQELHPRDRWVGPGVVVLSNNKTIYVAMRTRLWRCAPEQLRAALPSEVLGKDIASSPGLAELLRQVNSGTYKGAVDITKERFPAGDEQLAPVERDEQGVGQVQDMPAVDRPTEAPQDVVPVPPGLLPVGPSSAPVTEGSETRGRRRSLESNQTVSEPEPVPSQSGTPRLPMLPSIPEDGSPHATSRPSKTPRLALPRSPRMTPEPSSSSTRDEVNTRAPGSPVGGLLQNVSQEPLPPHMVLFPDEEYTPLTPGEDLSTTTGRVAQQVSELEERVTRERSPRRTSREGSTSTIARDDGESYPSWFQEQGWSGSVENYYFNGTEDFALGHHGKWTLLAKRGDEISLKDLSRQEKELFDASDKAEWSAILSTKAVRVITGEEAMRVRKSQPDRIISSRMVRRRKPQPGLNAWKAKSRWCLHGHADPDTGTLVTYAPTPQAEGMSLFLQASLNLEMRVAFGDVKNAFCQSQPLRRPRGPLYAEPCQGLHLPPGALIAIDVPVYGLDDAPAAWRTTVASFLTEKLGFERNLVEPCWFTKFCPKSQGPLAHILVEVDDFIVASRGSYYDELKKSLTTRFTFGKWEEDKAEYAGRFIECKEDRILISQEKCISEQIFPISLPKARRGEHDSPLTKEEFEAFRSLVYKLNWVGRESRPEVAGTASIMASRLPQALVRDVITVNKVVNHLRCTANRPLIIWKFLPEKMVFVVCSDAGGINTKHHDLQDEQGLPTDATQGSWMVLTAEALPEGNKAVRATPITWRSSKLKRKVFSTFGGETQAMLQGVNEVDWLQIMYRDAVFHDVELKEWRNSLSPHMVVMRGNIDQLHRQPQCSVTDAKSLYDCLLRGNPSGKQDRKSALELAIILKDLQETQSMIRWVPHQKMLVDCMTKESIEKSNGAMTQFLKSGWLSLVDVQQELHNRKHDANFRNRSLKASTDRLLREYADQLQAFCLREFGQHNLVGTDLMFQ